LDEGDAMQLALLSLDFRARFDWLDLGALCH